jgi:PAT family beta-lactamase induction signal transducer AmpG
MNQPRPSYKHPLFWVPSLYLAMGLPNATVSLVSKTMYKNLGISNEDIAIFTGLMYLPWVLKPLWAPLMEPYLTKRKWVLAMQFLMSVSIGLVAFALPLPGFFRITLACFWITGFSSGTQDIAADAIYLTTLPLKEQAKYAGIQGICWNCGAIIASGALTWFTGKLHDDFAYSWAHAWGFVMILISALMAVLAFWHLRVMPPGEPSSLHGGGLAGAWKSVKESWVTFFQKKSIGMMLTVVFMYRFGEGFIENFGQLFLLDPRSVGGMGFTNQQIGNIYGVLGTIGFLAGALLGGFFSAKFTLRRSFFFLAVALNVPHVTYFFLSHVMPHNMVLITAVVTIEKFGFGFGSVGHMLYMMQQIAPGAFKMTHYAFATGVMALTKMVTGPLSALVFRALHQNYPDFFLFVLLASIPPILIAWFAPFPQSSDGAEPAAVGGH